MTAQDAQSQTKVVRREEGYSDEPCRPVDTDPDDGWRGDRASSRPTPGREAALTVSSIASTLVCLAGLSLVLAPYALGHSAARSDFDDYWNDVGIGVAIGLVVLVPACPIRRRSGIPTQEENEAHQADR